VIESIGMEKSFEKIAAADVVLCILDAVAETTEGLKQQAEWLKQSNAKILFIVNKMDDVTEADLHNKFNVLDNPIFLSAKEKKHIERAVNNLLENLTKREYEIAILVGRGESNKQIARRLDITERTVKAHLTEIFRKLAITDRIKLALLVKDTAVSSNQTVLHHSNSFPIASA